jgi:hypothetical protein
MKKGLIFSKRYLMQHIPLVLAVAGMVLAREVRRDSNPSSPPVCGKGMELTDGLIDRLRTMGIQTIYVEGHPVVMEGERTLEEELAFLDHRFRKVGDDPLMVKLKELFRARLINSWGGTDGG